jgi:hypothetical protein
MRPGIKLWITAGAALAGSYGQEPVAGPRPAWLHDMPVVLVSNHDSMPIFRRRVGGNTTYQVEEYEKEHTEEAMRKLKELGVTVVITHFYKGFGLEAEKEHQRKALELVRLARKYGMKVGVYVGSTIAYETFLAEKPEAESWFVPDYLGRPVFYSEQPWRKRSTSCIPAIASTCTACCAWPKTISTPTCCTLKTPA